ncbi:MAG: hypothetical protein J7K89_00180 [Candidatus Cloacimonetes bacterium]|nr:hypothetical protein [Candidatus Cloacimonadota bacterium]
MQIDMHFYAVYALCRLAGIHSIHAQTIAYASQFVDDQVKGINLIFRKCQKALRPVLTSHKPLDYQNAINDDQWRVWTAFHFLPGNQSKRGIFEEKMICRKNSELANRVMEHAIQNCHQPSDLFGVGMAAHSFADTFAHYGFIGISTEWNKVKDETIHIKNRRKTIGLYIKEKFASFKGRAAELIPIGHGAVATFPDRPYLKWEFQYERNKRKVERHDNPADYLQASALLYGYFCRMLEANSWLGDGTTTVPWSRCERSISTLICNEAKKNGRVKAWKKFIKGGAYFATDQQDAKVHYLEGKWNTTVSQRKRADESQVRDLPLYHFMKAAQDQIELVSNYLVEVGITFPTNGGILK